MKQGRHNSIIVFAIFHVSSKQI